jgi:glutamate dehydrogenase
VAAFNHVHIFLDPDPDPERSFRERERLFHLARSSWRDYDASLISRGGGIFDRSAKAIHLSPELKKLLEIQGEAASGEEVIRRILTARVDLLYNGGIGTYVKAASETDTEVGARTNDRVRVVARDVRARAVGEGGNLGLTQKARIEYWAGGGLLNTDAVDNSGGVDTSDHEVNIKILLDMLIKKGVVKGREERNHILAEMTEEVAALVLADNENQSVALTLDGVRSAKRYEEFVNLTDDMTGAGVLNRADDAVPSREELLSSPHRGRGLPRPLLAVLLGHTKMFTFEMLMETGFPDSTAGRPFLEGYFPRRLRESFREHFDAHVLRREIIATGAVNHLINKAGISFLTRVMAASKAGLGEVVTAYVEVESEAGAGELREAVLSAGLAAGDEQGALLEIEEALEDAVRGRLEGKKKTEAATVLKAIRARLKL